ncbi:MAG: hypothetical protein JW741_27250, partial [Sedimentisphaerales bacterium]|nr:hypothetical protein [Sedimentisphaerales bacterium]
MNGGFIKLKRGSATWELLGDPNAFLLLTAIALRARWTDGFNCHGLKAGQALIGDYRSCGLTRQQYRSAQTRLQRYGLIDVKATTRGTVATLLDQSVYDINVTDQQPTNNQQATNRQPTTNQQATTNKKEKKEKKEKKGKKFPVNSVEFTLSQLLLDLILESKSDFRRPDLQRWAVEVDRMIRLDHRTPERIEAALRACQRDPFWQNNILSTAALRKHFDRL